MTISIEDFVKTALLEISSAVVKARAEAEVTIAPGAIEGKPIFTANEVHFEIHVEAVDAKSVGGGVNAAGSILSVVKGSTNLDGNLEKSSSLSHKVSFAVPVHFNSSNIRKR